MYTPFLSDIGKTLGQGLNQKLQQELIQSAYMGMPGALEKLHGVNPQAAQQIERGRVQREQQALQSQRYESEKSLEASRYEEKSGIDFESRKLKAQQDIIKKASEIQAEVSKFDQYDQAKSYFDQQISLNQDLIDAAEIPPEKLEFTPDKFNQIKKIHAKESKTGFKGSGLTADVLNKIVKGSNDEEYRKTTEYSTAWGEYTKPEIVRTPSGDMQIDRKIPEGILPPITEKGAKPAELEPGKEKPKVITGTEKTSPDQKQYNKDYALLKDSYDSLSNYIETLKELGPQISVGPINAKDTKRLDSAYTRAKLDAKETNKLGALVGPDEKLIDQLLGNPIGWQGLFTGEGGLTSSAEEAMKQITDRYATLNEVFKDSTIKAKDLIKDKKDVGTVISEDNLTATIDGKVYKFPSIESLHKYKEAAGL